MYMRLESRCKWILDYTHLTILYRTINQTLTPSGKQRVKPSWIGGRGLIAKDYGSLTWKLTPNSYVELINGDNVFGHHRGMGLISPHCYMCGKPIFPHSAFHISSVIDRALLLTPIQKIKSINKSKTTYWGLLLCVKCKI